LWPEPYAAQVVRRWDVTVNDIPVTPQAVTAQGDRCALWSAAASPGDIAINAAGVIETEDRAGLVTGLTVRPNPAIFLRPTDRTRADKAVRDIMSAPDVLTPIPWLHDLMREVHLRLPYVSGSTTIDTTAIEALRLGAGVCQDHAHLFIAVARAHGIPARYVTGYMLADGTTDDLHETHAWAEVWIEELGWLGFDPSSGICTTERYVRLTTGLDAADAAPVRGHATGGGALGVLADVRIREDKSDGSDDPTAAAMLQAQQQQQ
jgi:transglutaminase-like putative cysteine protease